MKMLGLFLFALVVNIYHSDAVLVDAVQGSNATLTCPFLPGTWSRRISGDWALLINGQKYANLNTAQITILNVEVADSGDYVCNSQTAHQEFTLKVIVYGQWTDWSVWYDCSVTCGQGIRTRYRSCDGNNQNGGGSCLGFGMETESCSTSSCTVNGQWSNWGSWVTCSVTCGGGTQYRNRSCNNPSPANGGSECQGLGYESVSCNSEGCPVNGQWSIWGSWVACSVTCGGGTQYRNRSCNNPSPANGGSECQGLKNEIVLCNSELCPVNGQWSNWGVWTACSVTCGDGIRTQYRDCNNPQPAFGGTYCQGLSNGTGSCNNGTCPEPLESSSIIASAAGGASGGIVAVALVVVIVFICNKRSKLTKQTQDRKNNKKLYGDVSSVTFRNDSQHEGMYINIGRPSMLSSSETDEDLSVRTSVQKVYDNGGNTYYNVEEIITIVQIEKLKEYIAKKKINDILKEDYKKIPNGMQHPTTKAELKDNMPKNRFKTTFPYDHTRVILETVHGTANSDYINANYIDGFEKDKCYIASQGPIKQTIQDHWRMIWQNNTRKIVMLTNLIEGGKPKCEKYWPTGGKPMTQSNMVLTLISEKERAAYITREISVEDKKSKEKRSVIQYHFTAWPDHGTPDPLYLVLFHKHFSADHNQIEGGPILVHCSAGIGRTGTFIALDALLEEGRSTGYVDIEKYVKKMRYCRMNMIQTADQYVCLHKALLEAFTMDDTSITKEQFGQFWREIQCDKRPINQQKLNEEFKKLNAKKSEHENVQYAHATSTENIDKNRSRNVLAMDDTRLYLVSFEKGRSNYINAVQVPSYTKFVGYLTTQLPLPDTKIDFWTMIRDHNSSTIVLIVQDLQEADMVYSRSDDSFICGPFSVKKIRQERDDNKITETTLLMTKKDEKPREITLFQTTCKNSPNPQDLGRLYNFISTRISMSNEPVTVVSCDGAKNCGLFCTFVNAVSSMQIDGKADIFQLARLLQLRRPEFFSDFEEYRLCYEALNFYLESTNVYDNLSV